jgi:hypothetical protein
MLMRWGLSSGIICKGGALGLLRRRCSLRRKTRGGNEKFSVWGGVRGLELGFSFSSWRSKSAYAAGGYLFRFAGKSNQKEATSFRKKQNFFYAGQTG